MLTAIIGVVTAGRLMLPTFDPSKLTDDYKSTTINNLNSQSATTYQSLPGEPVKLSEVPDFLKKGLVDVEDVRFYEHSGIDFHGILRAVYHDIITVSPAEGGSTLTQQLARNVYLTLDRTPSRKLQELYLSAQIERHFSKDDILEMYLNRMYFGNGAFGVKAAAETYFGKGQAMKSLSLSECAFLAGVLNAPSADNPWVEENIPRAIARRDVVLEAMYRNGDITDVQRKQAESEPLRLVHGTNVKGLQENTPKSSY